MTGTTDTAKTRATGAMREEEESTGETMMTGTSASTEGPEEGAGIRGTSPGKERARGIGRKIGRHCTGFSTVTRKMSSESI